MKPALKKHPSHTEDICDAVRCKKVSTIIIRYITKYEDGLVDFCDEHYKEHLEYFMSKSQTFVVSENITILPEEPSNSLEKTAEYESIEDYSRATGKRFRMTKDQKQRNLSREEAFIEAFK